MPVDALVAQQLLLVRATQTDRLAAGARSDAPWLDDGDRQWAAQTTGRDPGARTDPQHQLARRAERLAQRLYERAPGLPGYLQALRWPRWLNGVVLAGALLLGLATDAIGRADQINLLAAPLLGVLLWNLAVVIATVTRALTRRLGPRGGAAQLVSPSLRGESAAAAHADLDHWQRRGQWLTRGLNRAAIWHLTRGAGGDAGNGALAELQARFTRDWLKAATPLHQAHASALMHAAAAALAIGLLAGLYLRGLGIEYRAGWESTFLDAGSVRVLLTGLFGPASLISGIALPDLAGFEGLHFPSSGGAAAAPWIHLIALTVGMFAIAPRLVLAVIGAHTVHRLHADFPVPWQDPLLIAATAPVGEATLEVLALPCGATLSADRRHRLHTLLQTQLGHSANIQIAPALAPEQADNPASLPPIASASVVVVVFNASATPEAETHGAFTQAVQAQLQAGARLQAWVDESGFAQRFGHSSRRLDERRAAWRALLSEAGVAMQFVSLAPPA